MHLLLFALLAGENVGEDATTRGTGEVIVVRGVGGHGGWGEIGDT